MGIHLSITSTVLPLFTMLFQKFVVSLTQFIYFVQTKIQILLYKIILSGGQLSGGQLSGVNCRGTVPNHSRQKITAFYVIAPNLKSVSWSQINKFLVPAY